MRIAVIADIHGNLEAFQSVLRDIDGSGIQHIVSVGDNIGYGAESEAVMALIRERGILSVLGNHEMAVRYPRFFKWFNPQVQATLQSTFAGLSSQTLADIHRMPSLLIRWGSRFVHGFPPKSPFLYLYQMRERKICRAFHRIDEKHCFIGHTHELNLIRVRGGSARYLPFSRGVAVLENDAAYLINVGSVGQPRDGDNRAKYVIWDISASSVEVRRVSYDIDTAIRKILDAGYPESFAARLR
ncbi:MULTISPECIES: metallophosphoesterase family protein [Desulfococcus]|jgi:predicted phosphodiesterase|uniref:Calcineurin-like phosphoesterase superfamily domain containing protein n=1 Tax=Desulfococcus multivorans DSM 2059 TaxID=1121405 RepID=S7TX46_DESML|nr:metallophosphoesterase family protein [Desulfococcus multivorans]AOY58091.1 metallophosphoesterase [Desulfococcus multivorans]AQV00450.1 metallophosphatase family protein [Desulfococcus multivorans]EPR41340.1 Calcineurin-like phosphoesterase superfamily domain containing protein [Desulfococcus multivorans DSM 2059]MDX9818156.1 metallophosphoesterase family protein [Desulfococcus multivorans]SJZ72348.1 Predicted phosphodiesterase [Desulfococcus multivorans DSM 2059]